MQLFTCWLKIKVNKNSVNQHTNTLTNIFGCIDVDCQRVILGFFHFFFLHKELEIMQ